MLVEEVVSLEVKGTCDIERVISGYFRIFNPS